MWHRVGIIGFTTLALTVFLLVSVSLLALSAVFLFKTFGTTSAGVAYNLLIIVLLVLFASLLMLTFFQIAYNTRTRDLLARRRRRLEGWKGRWQAVLQDGEVVDGLEPNDLDAALALLQLRDALSGKASDEAASRYIAHGFLERDLQVLSTDTHPERRSQTLEYLALLRHPLSTEALLEETKRNEPELRHGALIALARTYGYGRVEPRRVVYLFYPLLTSGRFSKGMVEEALVLLGNNAAPVLKELTRTDLEHGAVRAALDAIGHLSLEEGAAWCLPYLESDLAERRAAALRALAQLKNIPADATPLILWCLRDPFWFVRAQAAKACLAAQVVPTEEADTVERVLSEALADPAWWVRHNAAKTLALRGGAGRDSLRFLARHHPDRFARDTALQALEERG